MNEVVKGERSEEGRKEREKKRIGGEGGGRNGEKESVISGFKFRQCCVWPVI